MTHIETPEVFTRTVMACWQSLYKVPVSFFRDQEPFPLQTALTSHIQHLRTQNLLYPTQPAMHISTLIAAFAATARAYEAVLYEDVGYSGREASFSFDGHHPIEYVLYPTTPLPTFCSF